MRELAFLIILLVMPLLAFGQESENRAIRDHPEFSAAKIQSQFVLGNWFVKRVETSKKNDEVSCKATYLSYVAGIVTVEDPQFCSDMAALFKKHGIGDTELVTVLVFLVDRDLREAIRKREKTSVPPKNYVLIGYREKDLFLSLSPSDNPLVNQVVSEIHSLDLGRVEFLTALPH